MIPYQELEYQSWPHIQKDRALNSAVKGVIEVGGMLHENFYKGFDHSLFVGHHNPFAYLANSEKLLAAIIGNKNPATLVIGKTINQTEDHTRGLAWLINGVDGYDNFANGRPLCDVMVVQTENGVPLRSVIYDFLRGELFYAVRGEGSYINGQSLLIPDREISSSTVIAYAPLVVKPERGIPEDKRLVEALWRGMESITSGSFRQAG